MENLTNPKANKIPWWSSKEIAFETDEDISKWWNKFVSLNTGDVIAIRYDECPYSFYEIQREVIRRQNIRDELSY